MPAREHNGVKVTDELPRTAARFNPQESGLLDAPSPAREGLEQTLTVVHAGQLESGTSTIVSHLIENPFQTVKKD